MGNNDSRLKLKNENREQIVEDIIQNAYLILLKKPAETQERFLSAKPAQQKSMIVNQVQWAVSKYFQYPVGGAYGRGEEYSPTKDVYTSPHARLKEYDLLEERDIETAENSEESWPYAKASIKLSSSEPNAYVLEVKRQLEEELSDNVSDVLLTITPREEKIIRMRFGLPPYEENTLEQAAQKIGVTRERIRQIEAKALRKLRHPTRSHKLKHFAERAPKLAQKEVKEKPTHYFRWYVYDDLGSKNGTISNNLEQAIKKAQNALKATFYNPEYEDRTLTAVVQEVQEIPREPEESEKLQLVKKQAHRFRNVWEADQNNIDGKVFEGNWIEN